MKASLTTAAALLVWLLTPSPAHAALLTGAIVFNTTESGSFPGSPFPAYANTYGGDTFSFNYYVLNELPPVSLGGPFLNSDNVTTAPTRIAIDLSTPGTYSFTMLADSGDGDVTVSEFWGLNLFFAGNDTAPRISVYGRPNATSAAFFPSFAANSALSTATLDPLTMGTAPGSGTVSWSDGSTMITLTHYRHNSASIFGVDRVSGFDLGSNGFTDVVSEFTLSVSAVPEPSSLILLGSGFGILGFLGYGRKKKGDTQDSCHAEPGHLPRGTR
jgi:hypothetical protein